MSQDLLLDFTTEISSLPPVNNIYIEESEQYEEFDNPKRIKCKHCKKTWKQLTTTSKKAHLASLETAIQYKITFCKYGPENVSTAMKKKFKKIEANQNKKRRFEYLVQEEMSFKHSEIVETMQGCYKQPSTPPGPKHPTPQMKMK